MTEMLEEAQELAPDFIELAAEIVSAYVANNPVPVAELPALIGNVHTALNGLAKGPASASASAAAEVEKATPSQIRKSITPDALISFIDGKPYKTLKRHLTGRGLDPHTYRERYGLPRDYPMVAAGYAAQRSELAKAIGLGRSGAQAQAEQPKARGRQKAH
jgi:predicted transcriptional regulator